MHAENLKRTERVADILAKKADLLLVAGNTTLAYHLFREAFNRYRYLHEGNNENVELLSKTISCFYLMQRADAQAFDTDFPNGTVFIDDTGPHSKLIFLDITLRRK